MTKPIDLRKVSRPSRIKGKTKKQGKINKEIVLKGLLEGKKLQDIGREAGSLARQGHNRAKIVSHTIKSEAFQKLMKERLPDDLLLEIHEKGLMALKHKRIKVGKDENGNDVYEVVTMEDHDVRFKYLDKAYELKGYAKQKGGDNNVQVNISIDQLAKEYGE